MEEVDIKDFQKLDIRIGTVKEASVPEWSHWVMKLVVDLGDEFGERTVFSGIMKFYKPEELEGKQFPFVVNLRPKKIGPEGDMSQGMMIMAVPKDDLPAQAGEETKPILFNLPERVQNGTKVS